MAITVGTSVSTSGMNSTSFTLVINAFVSTNDILVLAATNRDATAAPTVTDDDTGGNLWAMLANQAAGTNGGCSVWWKRATSATALKTITVSGMTGSCSGGYTAFRGASLATVTTTGPFTGTTVVSEANASADETQAQITTARGGSMVFLVVGVTSNDTLNVATQAATDPASLTERFEGVSTSGADCSCSLASAIKTTAGATGAFTWTMTNGTTASLAFALLPAIDDLVADSAAFTFSGTAAGLEANHALVADSAVFAFTANDATLSKGVQLIAESAAFTFTGTDVGLAAMRTLALDSAAFTFTGTDAGVLAGHALSADSQAFTFTGTDASLDYVPGAGPPPSTDWAPYSWGFGGWQL